MASWRSQPKSTDSFRKPLTPPVHFNLYSHTLTKDSSPPLAQCPALSPSRSSVSEESVERSSPSSYLPPSPPNSTSSSLPTRDNPSLSLSLDRRSPRPTTSPSLRSTARPWMSPPSSQSSRRTPTVTPFSSTRPGQTRFPPCTLRS